MESPPRQRQRVDLIDFLLDIDEDDFHSQLLYSLSIESMFGNKYQVQKTLFRKLERLQNLVFTEKPRQDSPQVYEELILGLPQRQAQIQVRDADGNIPLTICRSVLDRDDDREERLNTLLARYNDKSHFSGIPSFLYRRNPHIFKYVTALDGNEFVQDMLAGLMECNNLDDLEIRDKGTK